MNINKTMSWKDLDKHCIEGILDMSSDFDVCRFRKAFPEHKEAVNAVWTHRPEINVDNALIRDAAKLLKAIRRRKKLKRLTFKRCRHEHSFTKLPAVIASNCSELEVLNIPGLTLSPNNVSVLCSCTSLKHLNIKYYGDSTEFVEQLVAKNPQLEGIRLESSTKHDCVTNNLFENLPETIKQIQIINDGGRMENYYSFRNRLLTWRLEKLEINVILTEEDILILSMQTTLKYLSICFGDVGNSFEMLFGMNSRLEEVSLTPYTAINGTCLKYLPPTLKSLKCLSNQWNLDGDAFVECIKTWRLQSLSLCLNNNINLIMRALNAAATLSDIYIDIQDTIPDQNFRYVEKLAQLKVLHLKYDFSVDNNWLKSLLENCVNLQKLKLKLMSINHNISPVIAALPKLKEFYLGSRIYNLGDYVRCMQHLSISTSLTTVEFECCSGFTERDILLLIRECRTFKKLVLYVYQILVISKKFLRNVVLELEKQTDRRQVLTVEIRGAFMALYDKNISTTNLHPMLDLEFITWKYDW